jgi:hypothetical protein
MEEWYDPNSETYHCNDVNVKGGGVWWLVPRMLQMDPAEYVKMLIETYHADVFYFSDKSVLLMSWKSQTEMRKFKNWVNKRAREMQFYVED